MDFHLVVAIDKERGIGKGGKLPWHIPGELQYFAHMTQATDDPKKKNAVIMGRKSWESIPDKFRPLPGRLNIILTRNEDYALPEDVPRVSSFEDALKIAQKQGVENAFVIGGGHVFEESIKHKDCAGLYLTEVLGKFDCDTFFPKIDEKKFKRIYQSDTHEDNDIEFRFVRYERI